MKNEHTKNGPTDFGSMIDTAMRSGHKKRSTSDESCIERVLKLQEADDHQDPIVEETLAENEVSEVAVEPEQPAANESIHKPIRKEISLLGRLWNYFRN